MAPDDWLMVGVVVVILIGFAIWGGVKLFAYGAARIFELMAESSRVSMEANKQEAQKK